ncbi:MAG: hypothetical protein ACETWR_24870, partial [Anaerolineae bacterium]
MGEIAPARIPPGLIRFGLVAIGLVIVTIALPPIPPPPETPTPTPTVNMAATQTAIAVEVKATVLAQASATTGASSPTPMRRPPTATPIRTRTPTSRPSTPTPCGVKPSSKFYNVWQANQKHLGCPIREIKVFTAEQPFENGFMFWREDQPPYIYVLHNKGTWHRYIGTFAEGQPETAGYSPPPGLQEPRRGFGQVWRDELGGPDSEIGWATYHEQGFPDDRWVDCEHGMMLWSGQWGDPWGVFVL